MGERWDVRGQNEKRETGRCPGLLIPGDGWDLSSGVNNGREENAYILL